MVRQGCRWFRVLSAMSAVMVVAASCGDDSDEGAVEGPPYDVVSEDVSHETTVGITVWAPDADGEWPVVYALHGTIGMGASRRDWEPAGEKLASEGVVVFAADNRQTPSTGESDAECGYRYALSIAENYGGDLDQPITSIGHSLGASMVLVGGLNADAYGPGGTYDQCFSGAARPDVIVPIAGCHYSFGGRDFPPDTSLWTRDGDGGPQITVIGLENDTVCPASQSVEVTAELQAAGYDASYVEIAGANHYAPLFGDVIDDEWLVQPDASGGDEVVQTILNAIEMLGL
jgi:acetyl esterase/lipase